MSRKIIWKVCLTLEHTFIFGKILVTFQGLHRLLPGTAGAPGHTPVAPSQELLSGCSGLWRGQRGPAGPSGQLGCGHRGGDTGMQAQGCRHRDAGAGMLVQGCSWQR